jgi:hypothetical protein
MRSGGALLGNRGELTAICMRGNRQFDVGPGAVEQSVASTFLADAHQFFLLRLQC